MLPIELWSKVANNLLETDCLNLFIILIHTNMLNIDEVKLLKKWYNLFNMPSSYKIMNKIYRNINSITTKKIYINYFNKVSNSLYQLRSLSFTKADFISISTQRQKFIDKIKSEKNKRKFANITKKLDYAIF